MKSVTDEKSVPEVLDAKLIRKQKNGPKHKVQFERNSNYTTLMRYKSH